MTPSQEFT